MPTTSSAWEAAEEGLRSCRVRSPTTMVQGMSRLRLSAPDVDLETVWGFVTSQCLGCAQRGASHASRSHNSGTRYLTALCGISPMPSVRTQPGFIRWPSQRSWTIFFNKMNMIPHGPCAGLKGACVVCIQALEAALQETNFLDQSDAGLRPRVLCQGRHDHSTGPPFHRHRLRFTPRPTSHLKRKV